MADNYSRKAKFDTVKYDMKALEYHKSRYENGSIDPLAKMCYQHWQLLKNRTTYQIYLDETGAKE